ncbi:cellulose synthase subunit BcsC-related outer membrane protein [Dyella sp. C9]|uniref:cellulose synthase subunit BcsC-related outer membrane protein n=1 Tax=Dyella sp. C9 TaxID=2202154 RepID=UPI000DEEDAE3|nr:cellulose synthase subunit BcsC-related outer membrane protein [Dyella sp. C9]
MPGTLSSLLAAPVVLLMAATPCVVLAQAAAPSPQVSQLLSSGRMWQDKGRPDMARGVVQKALLIQPNQPDAMALMGEVELSSNRPAEAAKILQQLQQRYPGHPATIELADAYRLATTDKMELAEIRLLSSAGKADEAWVRMQKLFPRGAPTGPVAGDYYRLWAAATGQRDRAISDLRSRIAKRPDDLNLALVLADLLTDRDGTRLEGLGIIYRVYLRPDGNRARALELWRRALNSAGSSDTAYYVWYQRYLKEVPDDVGAKQALADLAKKGGAKPPPPPAASQVAGTQPVVQPVVQSPSRTSTTVSSGPSRSAREGAALGEQGLQQLRAGHHQEAQALFARALKLDPDNAGKWRSLMKTAQFWGIVARARQANAQAHPEQGEALAREALRIEPDNAEAKRVLASALIAQQKWPQAEAVLRPLVNAPAPDLDALRDLIQVLHATHRDREIDPLIASVEPRVGRSGEDARKQRAELLSIEADRLLDEGKRGAALGKLEAAVRLTPDDAWLRYTLARLYRDLGLPGLGRGVMEDGLRVAPSADMHYATALYLNSLDDIAGANAQLSQVPPAERSSGMRELATSLRAQADLRQARELMAQGRRDEAGQLLDRIAAESRDDPQMLASVGREWITLGQPDKGLKLVRDWLDAHPDDPAIGVRLRYGDLLAAANRDDELGPWIADARARPGVTADQQASFDSQLLRLAIRTAGRQMDAGDYRGAARTLDAVPAPLQSDPRWLLAQADLLEAQRDYRGAEAYARKVLATHPGDPDARLTVARMEERMGHRKESLRIVREVQADTAPDDIDTQLAIARRYSALGENAEALAIVQSLRQQYPDRSDITLQMGRTEQSRGRYDDAAALYRAARVQEQAEGELPSPEDNLTSAQRALQGLDDRRQGQVATAVIQSDESGDGGISRLNATEIPLYVRIPDGYTGHYFFHADTVLLDAGELPANYFPSSYKFGQIAAYGTAGLPDKISETDKGVALAAGYEFSGANNSWRADIGRSPVGFTVGNILGGFLYRHDFYDSSLTVDVSRRPVTSSMLSYAGARDPVTGETWGGVVRSGVTVRGAQDWGRTTLFASVGYGVLSGRNVEDNHEFKVRTGFDLPIFEHPNQRLVSGLVINYWQYSDNQHYYTFGNGGYYSPQQYKSISIPLDWMGRYGRWSWELDGSVGNSWTREDESPFFPTRPDLQALAVARMAAADLGSPYFGGGTGGGFSYTVEAALEYRIAPHWVAGTRLKIDRSHDYAPNLGMLYLRYFFDEQRFPVPFPPNPVKPYSAY